MTRAHRKRLGAALLLATACGGGGDTRSSYDTFGGVGSTNPRDDDSGSVDVGESDDHDESEGGKSGSDEGDGGAAEGDDPKWDLASADDGGSDTGPGECPAPALMIVLDRSFSMAQSPNGAGWAPDVQSTKWAAAVAAIEGFVGAYDQSIELGFAMFPSPADNQYCDHVIDVITDADVDGLLCTAATETGPAPGTGPAIADRIDAVDTRLCKGTPIDAALQVGGTALAASVGTPNIVLVTDGKEKCGGDPVGRAQLLAQAGVFTWVIGFGNLAGDAVGHQTLNHLACAGHTASNFMASCADDGLGNFSAIDPGGAALYLPAEDGPALADAFSQQIAGNICCGSACPPG